VLQLAKTININEVVFPAPDLAVLMLTSLEIVKSDLVVGYTPCPYTADNTYGPFRGTTPKRVHINLATYEVTAGYAAVERSKFLNKKDKTLMLNVGDNGQIDLLNTNIQIRTFATAVRENKLTLQETQVLARMHWANIPALEYHVQCFGTLDNMIRALENKLSLLQVLAKATRTITNPQWLNGSLMSFIELSIRAWAEFPCCSAQQLAAAIAKEMQGTNKHGGYLLHSLTEFATNQVDLNTLQKFLTDHWSQLTQMRSSRPIDQRNAPRPQNDNTQRTGLNQRSSDTQCPERQVNSYNSSRDRRDRNDADQAPQRGLYSPHYPRGGQRVDTPPAPTPRAQYTPMQRDRSCQLAQHPATPSAQAP
jgi:hypothetical protein